MVIIGCDFHPGFQQIAVLDREIGEVKDLHLAHREEAERDARQPIVHRHKRVQMRTRVSNQSQAPALNQGLRLYWMLREGRDYAQLHGRYAGKPASFCVGKTRPAA